MATLKFQLVTERFVGRVPTSLAKKWARLAARQKTLETELEELKAAVTEFEECLGERLPEDALNEAHDGFRLEPDGRLYQVLCKCFECQAKIQTVSVIDTVEGMIRAGLIKKGEEAATRAHAYKIESSRREEEAVRQLLN